MTADQLRKAREESANVAYLTFTKHIKADKLGLFCFFEGKDSPYYISRIRSVFSGNYYPIVCSGKSKVLKVYDLINNHEEYTIYRKAFFVDKDFDPSLSNSEIYETVGSGLIALISEEIAIDKQPDQRIMNHDRLGKTNRATSEPFQAGTQR